MRCYACKKRFGWNEFKVFKNKSSQEHLKNNLFIDLSVKEIVCYNCKRYL